MLVDVTFLTHAAGLASAFVSGANALPFFPVPTLTILTGTLFPRGVVFSNEVFRHPFPHAILVAEIVLVLPSELGEVEVIPAVCARD